MAKVRAGIIVWDDTNLVKLLQRLEPGSPAYNFFVRDAMRKAVASTKPIVVNAAIAAGYPAAPGIRMHKGKSRPRDYVVWGRVVSAVRAGRFVLKRRDGGDTSQRVIIGQKRRGNSAAAPHANITRYSKNTERFTKTGRSRGKFAAIPFVDGALAQAQGILFASFKKSYIKFATSRKIK